MSDTPDTPDDDEIDPDDEMDEDATSPDDVDAEDGDESDDESSGDSDDHGTDDSSASLVAGQHRPDQTTTMKIEGPTALRSMMTQYFMEYASYVIKDRAIPDLRDGLKPVQRRIMHTLFMIDDGKYHKVANVVGDCMKLHPHGDASIYAALVHIANKDFFIDKQGNFGNLFTGDNAAAARYIECRLSPLAREVLFDKELTEFIPSYDGRNQEPVCLPAKVPVLLMQGTEGIAVGMSTRILSHNFNELLDAQIEYLRHPTKPIYLYPDFIQGGIMDVSEYDDGNGKIRLRAMIKDNGKNSLAIREIPATTTTESLIASIEDAANKGKLKLSQITDYTAESVEIDVQLTRGSDPDRAIKALYAYTDCEVSISCNCLVIDNNRPRIMSVSAVLKDNTNRLVDDLRRQLEFELAKLAEQFHAKTLAQIFIENRIYKRIEECTTQPAVLAAVHQGLAPFREQLTRDVTDEDVEKLLQIPIRRISLFDINKNRRELDDILARMEEIRDHLANIVRYTIDYIKGIKKQYGHLYPRRTRIDAIEQLNVREIALKNVKIGHDRGNGFVGTSIKAEDPLTCTEYDRLLVMGWDGTYKVIPIPDKLYVGSVCAVFKADRDQTYAMIYRDKKDKAVYSKRFKVDKYIMEKEYKAIPKGCKVEKLFDRYGVELRCEFEPMKGQKIDHVMLNFDEIPIRAATAKGLKVHSRVVAKFLQTKRGSETDPNAPVAPTGGTTAGTGDDGPPGLPPGLNKLAMPGTQEVAIAPSVRKDLTPKTTPARKGSTPAVRKTAIKVDHDEDDDSVAGDAHPVTPPPTAAPEPPVGPPPAKPRKIAARHKARADESAPPPPTPPLDDTFELDT